MRRFITLLFFCFLSIAVNAEETAESLFGEANKAYAQGDFANAATLYEQVLGQGQESSALHYNLGCCYYQLSDTGKAVLHLEKALALNPYNHDAQANLIFVRKQAELDPEVSGFLQRFAMQLPINYWAIGGCVLFWMLVFAVVLPRYFKSPAIILVLMRGCLGILLLVCLTGLGGYHLLAKRGIALKTEAPLSIAPAPESPAGGYLNAGESARVIKQNGDYYFVRTENGKSGWIHQECFEKIWD